MNFTLCATGGECDVVIPSGMVRLEGTLGEASHGTHEFYTWRAEISKRLIEEQQYRLIAVEGDWPAWMWANREMVDLVEWLRAYTCFEPNQDDTQGDARATAIVNAAMTLSFSSNAAMRFIRCT